MMKVNFDDEKWADLTPIPNPGDENGPFGIRYGGSYGTTMEYFRALMNINELSERALEVVTFLCQANPSNPAPFWYRQRILEKIGYNFDEELEFTTKLANQYLKPYQIWNHRQWLVSKCENPPDETGFMKFILKLDCKNFHAWEYFYWLAETYDRMQWLFDQATLQVQLNSNNNSAWSMRYSSMQKINLTVNEDIQFVLDEYKKNPESRSIASYLLAYVKLDTSIIQKVKDVLNEILSQNGQIVGTLTLLAQIAEFEGNHDEYCHIADKIIELDEMHANFWNLMKSDSSKFK
ncbi:Protein farnesyltransferase/geranylgeranyltransferase type-1 subunit alpha [Tritrichomonas foetus]|uniref:Protein farnesyltransferase/geranylgeranyltransferase type-1 subunit alpha n=1 Tax=Tritrichomonas foetus TaxID=1144522 RepID=A0A1J4KWE7_9EUKA|nr:Protein farnesyltransferase/geranylgeranyltransferase type-1 subunit alpha [Tritrichomonas foetus]|eukprot:OHT15208.1 Protein farnesyltransferase/geranylgeranyltransferase type-1 subunit alpha [Tritrichomonas foetus]